MKTEFDVSNIAWETYKLLYEDNYVNGFQIISPSDGRKYIGEIYTVGNKKSSIDLNFSGDTDFNYTKGYAHSRLEAYKNLVNDDQVPEEYKKIYFKNLDIFVDLTYSIVNVSLIPQSGNLQAVKQGIGNDRLDTFVWVLDEFYSERSNVLFNHSSAQNMPALKVYLGMFNDVYEYCRTVYHINESLVDDMVESGRKAIDTPEGIMGFMNLTFRFWTQKAKYLYAKAKEKNNNEIIKLLDEFDKKINLLFEYE